jgi:ABC-type transport system substrate-binding protein
MKGFKLLLLVLAAFCACFEASPAAAENVLRWASAAGAATLDPHAYDEPQTSAQYRQVYEALIGFDSNLELVPQLATTWRLVGPTTWEFRLRPNVRFHDGTPLTARDVVFSFARAKAELPVGFAGRIESIAEVRRIGEHTVQIVTKFPDPHSFLPKYNQEATKQVYEALLDIDFNLAIVPQLALAWGSLNPTTWEFKLRPHVTFHNGEPFTAADVVFSIERARAESSDFRGYVAGIATIERRSTIAPSASRPARRTRRCG